MGIFCWELLDHMLSSWSGNIYSPNWTWNHKCTLSYNFCPERGAWKSRWKHRACRQWELYDLQFSRNVDKGRSRRWRFCNSSRSRPAGGRRPILLRPLPRQGKTSFSTTFNFFSKSSAETALISCYLNLLHTEVRMLRTMSPGPCFISFNAIIQLKQSWRNSSLSFESSDNLRVCSGCLSVAYAGKEEQGGKSILLQTCLSSTQRFCLSTTVFYKNQGEFLLSIVLKISPNFEVKCSCIF